jgi:hypothetical protein
MTWSTLLVIVHGGVCAAGRREQRPSSSASAAEGLACLLHSSRAIDSVECNGFIISTTGLVPFKPCALDSATLT